MVSVPLSGSFIQLSQRSPKFDSNEAVLIAKPLNGLDLSVTQALLIYFLGLTLPLVK